MRRALVVGAGGQLGRALVATAPPGVEVVALDRRALDVTDADAVARVLTVRAPDVVLNASGWTAVDAAEEQPEAAWAVNAVAPGTLADACARLDARLVHVSTDYVFDGAASAPYRVTDEPAPLNVYGESKLAGERAVVASGGEALVVRTSWLHAAGGANFVRTMLRRFCEHGSARVVADQVGSPTWARGLAEVLWAAAARREVVGLAHWCDMGQASWYELAVAVAQEGEALGLVSGRARVTPIASAEWPQAAARPRWSVLDVGDLPARIEVEQRPWRVQLRAMLAEEAARERAP